MDMERERGRKRERGTDRLFLVRNKHPKISEHPIKCQENN